jgi:FixJ family two-component response regulator
MTGSCWRPCATPSRWTGALARRRSGLDALRQRLASLTPREREVLAHVVTGRLNKQIAADLGTVEKTIKVHRARIMEKMAVRSLAELVRIADRLGITPANRQEEATPAPRS